MDFEHMGYIYILSKASSIAFKVYILSFPILTGNRTHNLVVSAMLYCLRYKNMLTKSFELLPLLKVKSVIVGGTTRVILNNGRCWQG